MGARHRRRVTRGHGPHAVLGGAGSTLIAASPNLTDWLTGIGGAGAFLATIVLAILAYCQMRAGRTQAREAREQSDAALASALELTRETRQAAERQWQPRVFVHGWHGPRRGDGDMAACDEMAVPYYLSNEGTGPAFNVQHGIEVQGRRYTWDDRQWGSMRAGEFIPQLDADAQQPVPSSAIVIGVKLSEWGDGNDLIYWARFENLLGERFEVRNHQDATRPVEFRPLAT
jgi:hypothetical protein